MNILDELIHRHCPNGVEFLTLSELFDTRNGYTPSRSNKEYWENGTVPWFRMEDIRANGGILSDSLQHVSEFAVKGKVFPANSLIVATSATIGEHALITVESISNQRFTYLMIKEQYKDKFDMKFLYYYCFKLDSYCLSCLNQGNFASVDMSKFSKFEFPLVPLPVQIEIVRILDTFTEFTADLTAELTAELTARKRQYEHYRDEILRFNNDVSLQKVKLSDVCKVYDGTHQTPNYTETGVKFASVENIQCPYSTQKHISVEDYQKYKIKPQIGDVLMTRIGSIGVCYVIDRPDDLAYYVSLALLRPDNKVLDSRYLKHYIESIQGAKELRKRTLVNAVPIKINKDDIGKIPILIPPIEVQKRIVDILDRFNAYSSDISAGLAAEIEARQKQYEYYRDKLLTFKEVSQC